MAQDFGFGSIAGDSLASMIGSMEQVRKMWSGIGVPGSLAPTVDPKELERRIADLRVVEQWLEVNLNMLKSTIQAFELQQGALAAMHSIGESMAAAMPEAAKKASPGAATAAPETAGAAAAPASTAPSAGDPAAWWDLLQTQFNQIAQVAIGGLDRPENSAPATTPAGAGSGAATAARSKRASGSTQASGAKRAAKPGRRGSPARATSGTGIEPAAEPKNPAPAPKRRKRDPK
ncbi:MAG: hypothetical protein KJZ83_00875 [Burkholderiaceae bacterium]|nr:hypothetical protein [Burkholderiaceae bacterium]